MAWRLAGMAGGIVAGWTLARIGPTVLAFPSLVGCLFLAVILDELGRPRPARERAVALVEVRRVRDYLPRPATEVASALAAVVIGGLAVAALAGYASAPPRPYLWHGPFSEDVLPGRGMPALVLSGLATMAVAVLATLVLLRSLVRAPRAGVDARALERDERRRRRVASTLVSCLGWTLSIPLVFFGFTLSAGISETGPWAILSSIAVTAVAVTGLFTAGWYGSKLVSVDG